MKLEMKPVYLLLGGVWLGILLLLMGTTGVHQNTLVGTAAQIGAISPATGTLALVTDGASASDCTTGGGSEKVWCWWDGSAWVILSAPSGTVLDPDTYANLPAASTNSVGRTDFLTADQVLVGISAGGSTSPDDYTSLTIPCWEEE